MFQYLIPEYIENKGDCCRLNIDGNESTIDKNINSVLKNLYRERYLDFNVVRKKCSSILNQKNVIPLFLSKDEIIMPVKLRKPKARHDASYGYINAYFIDDVVEKSVILKNKNVIAVLERKRAILKRIIMAKMIEKNFACDIRDTSNGYECAATKQDIAIVLMELEYIKRNMRIK